MKWIKVSERLPKVGQLVIYYFHVTGVSLGKYCGKTPFGHQFGGACGFLTDDVTHWMPMPEPPESGR